MKILFKLAIARRGVFSSKCTQNRLSAGLRPAPPLAGFKGATSKEQKGKGGARKERERVEGEGSRSGLPPSPYT